MFFRPSRTVAALLAAGLGLAPLLRAEPGHLFPPLTPDETAAIAGAVPARADAAPARPRAILVFYRTEGYVHPSIPYANEALRQIGARTGAYRADFSDDMSVFTPGTLARYDAVVFQNTTRLDFKDPAQRAALLAFVRSGKGLVGLHAASDNFYSWPEAQAMLGGVFHNHPWNSESTVAVKLDDPGSALTAAFGGHGFWIRDEIYQIVGPYSRESQRVLLSLDMTKAANYRMPEQIVRTDGDFPIAWVKRYGRGRVFYCSLGHNPDVYRTPEILRFYLDGIQFAIGDLAAVDTPPIRPIAPALPLEPAVPLQNQVYTHSLPAGWLEDIAAYDFGRDREPLIAVDIYLRSQGRKAYPEIEKSLLSLLARPSLTDGAKDYVLRTLVVIGSEASVPTLAGLLGDARFGSTAAQALFAIPGPASDAALLSALDSLRGRNLDTVIGAVGRRRLAAATNTLVHLGRDSADAGTTLACLAALGNIGTPDSLQALRSFSPDQHPIARDWAEISAASSILNHSFAREDAGAMEEACRDIIASSAPDALRIAALKVISQADNEMGSLAQPARGILLAELRDNRIHVRLAAANLVAGFFLDPLIVPQLIPLFPALDPVERRVLLSAFDSRAPAAGAPLFLLGLKDQDPSVRLAAIHGLGDTASIAAIEPLLARLTGDARESAAAVDSLGRLRAPGTVESVIAYLAEGASPAEKAAGLQILGDRVDHRVFPFALAAVDDPNAAVRAAAFTAIAAAAHPDDLPTVLALLPKTRTASERRSMEHALLEAVRAAPHPDAVVDAINTALGPAHGPTRYSLLTALALADTNHARAILASTLRAVSPQDRREAIRAIAGARNTNLQEVLLDFIRTATDPNERILALRAYLDLLQVPSGRSDAEVVEGYARAWPLAERPEERDAIIAGLQRVKGNEALMLIAKLEKAQGGRAAIP